MISHNWEELDSGNSNAEDGTTWVKYICRFCGETVTDFFSPSGEDAGHATTANDADFCEE